MKKIFVAVCVLAVTLLSSVNPASAERDTESDDVVCKGKKNGSKYKFGYVVLSPELYGELEHDDEPVCANLPKILEILPENQSYEFEYAGYCGPGANTLCKQYFTTTEKSDWVNKEVMYAYLGDQRYNDYSKWTVPHDGKLPSDFEFCLGPFCITP